MATVQAIVAEQLVAAAAHDATELTRHTVHILAGDRVVGIAQQDRTLAIEAGDRQVEVESPDRTVVIT